MNIPAAQNALKALLAEGRAHYNRLWVQFTQAEGTAAVDQANDRLNQAGRYLEHVKQALWAVEALAGQDDTNYR